MIEKLKEYLIITIGFILISFAVQYFYVPVNITGGGITGISIIINHNVPAIPMGLMMLILNGFLFIIGLIAIGGNFGGKTLYASFGLSFSMWFIEKVLNPHQLTNDVLLSAIIGTLIIGTGLGLVFSQNASTGGTDIIAKILNKYFHIDMGKSMQAVDLIVVILSAAVFNISSALYSFVCVLLNGFIIDKVIEGFNSVKAVMIFSNESEEIREYIIKDINRGCTIFDGKGGFSGDMNTIVYSVMDRTELIKLRRYIKSSHPESFIIVNEAHEVLGQGFQNIE